MIIERMKIDQFIEDGAIFYVSHSGGKDSQAMYAILRDIVPHDQIVVVHADLGVVEWEGVQDHIQATTYHPLNVVRSTKTFFEMIEHRFKTRPDVPPWPSSATRQCTSDLKRNPIHKFIRNDMKAKGATLALNCTGIRAEESSARGKKEPLKMNATLSKAGRTVYEYMPIFRMSTCAVFAAIKDAGQEPFHAYSENERLSCVFCIMGCKGDLKHGARQRPELYQKYIEIEERTGWTMFNGKSLKEVVEA